MAPYPWARSVKTGVWLRALGNGDQRSPTSLKAREWLYIFYCWSSSLMLSWCWLLQPGGSIFFTTISRTLLSYALTIVLAEYVFRVVQRGVHDWYKYITPDELKQLLSESMHQTFFSRPLRSSLCHRLLNLCLLSVCHAYIVAKWYILSDE